MLKHKVQALMNEPGCAANRAKAEGERKKGCGKALAPGAAAGGCAYDGAKIALQPITDAVHLVHGPIACEGNSWDTRNSASSGPDLYRRGFTTDLSELDVIHGGEKKLYRAISEAAERFSPPAIFVYQTCVTALIGDDIAAVCREASRRLGLPVIPVEAPGFAGSKNLGNRLGGEALLDHVIGTVEPADAGLTDVNILGEYNVAGELRQIRPLLHRLGIRIRACITGDARYREVAAAHRARAAIMLCSQALITLARKMHERWDIPFIEGSFYGIQDTSAALRGLARLLVERGADPALLERAEALIGIEEARAWARLEAFRPRLAGRRVLLYTGGVKSWSVVSALKEIGMEVIATSVRKATPEDRERAAALMAGEGLVEQIPNGEMYRLFRDGKADIMLSGGRTQFVALKSRTPWLDINQERHHAYAGYDGMVELVRQIDLVLNNPVWAEVRREMGSAPLSRLRERDGVRDRTSLTLPAPGAGPHPLPQAGEGTRFKALSVSPLKLSAPLGAALAFMGLDRCLPLLHGAQGCTAFALVAMVRHFREAIPLQTTAMNEITTILGGMDNVEEALRAIQRRAQPKVIGLISTALTETRGEDFATELRTILARRPELAGVTVVPVAAPDYHGSLETGWGKAAEALAGLARPAAATLPQVTLLPGVQLTPGDVEALREMAEDFGLDAIALPDLGQSLDGHVPDDWRGTTLGGTTLDQIGRLGHSRLTIAIGEHMRGAAAVLAQRTGVPSLLLERASGLAAVDRLTAALAEAAGTAVPQKYLRQRSQLVDAMLDAQFSLAGRRLALAGEPGLVTAVGLTAAELGARLVAVATPVPCPALATLPAERPVVGDFDDLETAIVAGGGCDLLVAATNGRHSAARLGVPLLRLGFPVTDRIGAPQQVSVGYRGSRALIFALANGLAAGEHHDAAPPAAD